MNMYLQFLQKELIFSLSNKYSHYQGTYLYKTIELSDWLCSAKSLYNLCLIKQNVVSNFGSLFMEKISYLKREEIQQIK